MTDREMYEIYRKWILEQTDSAYRIEEKSEDEIDFVTDCAVGHVQFYHLEYEICALTIESEKADEPLFFLHFEIKDLDHAKELFTQMIASLKKAGEDTGVKVLLSCTSGFTTSFFAEKLNGAAQTLGLDYDFSAVPYTDLFEAAMDKDVIMLAPQIGYLLKKAKEVLKDKIIIQIPADVFATYNVTRTVDLIKEELAKDCASVIISRRPCALLKYVRHPGPITVDRDKCVGCRSCMRVGCPAISMKDGKAVIDSTLCTGCRVCTQLCKVNAIG